MALLPKVKLKMVPTFPANVIGGVGLTSTKANGSVTVDYAWQEFGSISAIPTSPTSFILTYDTQTDAYVMVPSHLLGGAVAGISDAPNDGTLYGRLSANWAPIPITADAASDGTTYGRKNGAWVAVTSGPGGGIPEAPTDGAIYARKGSTATWVGALPVANPAFTGMMSAAGSSTLTHTGNNTVLYNGDGAASGSILLGGAAASGASDYRNTTHAFKNLAGSATYFSASASDVTFTSQPIGPTPTPATDSSTKLATTAFVQNAMATLSGTIDYPTRAAVVAATVPGVASYLRIAGFTTVGDGGAALYRRVGSSPAHPGKIQSADGAWWEISEPVLHASMFGVMGDGGTDNATTLQNAFNTLTALLGVLVLPRGTIRSTSAITVNIPVDRGIRVVGQGQDSTFLYFPTSSGLIFNYGNTYSSCTAADFSMLAGGAGNVAAIRVALATAVGNPANTSISHFSNITCRGSDGYEASNYWATCFDVSNVSNINFTNCMMTSRGIGGGTGISLAGLPASASYGVAYNIENCFFNALGIGLYYGSYIQGVSVTQSNFTGGGTGIYCNGTGVLQQLCVIGCQFGGLTASCLNCVVNTGEVYAIGNLFGISANTNGIQGIITSFTFTGNTFQGGANTNGILLNNGGIGIITGNCFSSVTTGVGIFAPPVTEVSVQSNFYHGVANPTVPGATTGSIQIGGGSR